MIIAESWMEHAAHVLGKPVHEIRARNLYAPTDTTHYGQKVVANLPKLWRDGVRLSCVAEQQKHVDAFNAANRYRKVIILVLVISLSAMSD